MRQPGTQPVRIFEKHGATISDLYTHKDVGPEVRRARLREHFAKYPVPQASMDVLLDHFDHAIEIAGPDHVGIGADWDGVPSRRCAR